MVKLKKSLTRIIAIFAAIVLCLTSVGVFTANAVSYIVNSSLSYNITVKKEADKEIAVIVDFTNALTLTTFEFNLYYDNKCTYVSADCGDAGYVYENTDSRYVSYVGAYVGKKGDFTFTYHFKTSDSTDKAHTFSACIVSYSTANGDIYSAKTNPDISFKTDDLYTIGDVDNDNSVTAIDASYVLQIIDKGYTTVTSANSNLSYIQKNICSSIVCAETADVNADRKITSTDSDAILNYYANKNVNGNYKDDYIGTQYYTTITA